MFLNQFLNLVNLVSGETTTALKSYRTKPKLRHLLVAFNVNVRWLADLCAREGIAFVLGHALYMKAIHGGKAKNDKIAALLRGGMIPQAYVYPEGMRSTRDLMRRRMQLMHQGSHLLTHIQNTNH